MANTNRQNVDSGETVTTTFEQPVRYHQVSVTGTDIGLFVRVPHLPVIDDIARSYGAEMAEVWYRAALRQLTQLGQSRASAKGVDKTREAAQAAAEKAFAEFADGSLKMRGSSDDDSDDSTIDGGKFNTLLREAAKPTLTQALEAAGKPTTDAYIDLAMKQYYNQLVERFGPQIAAVGYTPTKKGAGKAKAEKVELTLSL